MIEPKVAQKVVGHLEKFFIQRSYVFLCSLYNSIVLPQSGKIHSHLMNLYKTAAFDVNITSLYTVYIHVEILPPVTST